MPVADVVNACGSCAGGGGSTARGDDCGTTLLNGRHEVTGEPPERIVSKRSGIEGCRRECLRGKGGMLMASREATAKGDRGVLGVVGNSVDGLLACAINIIRK
jgi:hypothetical protein